MGESMRKIEFRAWDKKNRVMLPVKYMDFKEWWVSCDPTYGETNPLQYGERNSFENQRTDRHIIMQYTGLRDRNAKEIYEGDILASVKYNSNELSNSELRWEIYFNEERLTFYRRDKKEGIVNPFWEFNLGSVQHIVVGNIYENPELLTE